MRAGLCSGGGARGWRARAAGVERGSWEVACVGVLRGGCARGRREAARLAPPPSRFRGCHDDWEARNGGEDQSLRLRGQSGPSGPRLSRLVPLPRETQLHPNRDYEKMVGQTRNKLKEATSEPPQSTRALQSKRRRKATGAGAGEPELEKELQEEMEKPELLLQPSSLSGRNLPGGSRDYTPRKIRNLNAQNCLHLEQLAKTLLFGRFQFLFCFLEQVREKVHVLQTLKVSSRTTFSIGEQSRQESPWKEPDGAPARVPRC